MGPARVSIRVISHSCPSILLILHDHGSLSANTIVYLYTCCSYTCTCAVDGVSVAYVCIMYVWSAGARVHQWDRVPLPSFAPLNMGHFNPKIAGVLLLVTSKFVASEADCPPAINLWS